MRRQTPLTCWRECLFDAIENSGKGYGREVGITGRRLHIRVYVSSVARLGLCARPLWNTTRRGSASAASLRCTASFAIAQYQVLTHEDQRTS